MAILTDAERARIRYALGYPGTDMLSSMALGVPIPVQINFLIESAMDHLRNEETLTIVRRLMENFDAAEADVVNLGVSVVASSIGGLQLHPLKEKGKLSVDSLEDNCRRWAQRIADILRVPLGARYARRGPGTNVPVSY